MYMTSLTGFVDQSGTIPAVDLALDIINDNTTLLPGYTLTYGPTVQDSQASACSYNSIMFMHVHIYIMYIMYTGNLTFLYWL